MDIKEYIGYVKYASRILGESSNWMDFKKLMLVSLPSSKRKNFSTRDSKTKKQSLNEFEKEMIDIYFQETGVLLELEAKNG